MSIATVTLLDYSNEASTTKFHTVPITAANLATVTAQLNTLIQGIAGITMGVEQSRQFSIIQRGSGIPPTDQDAQREKKWLVTYADNSEFLDPPTNSVPNPGFGRLFNLEIPTADLQFLVANTDFADLDDDAMIAFRTPFEAFARSPYGGNVVVRQIRFVGRNI